MYWRGQIDPAFSQAQLTEPRKIGYLLGVDLTADLRDDGRFHFGGGGAQGPAGNSPPPRGQRMQGVADFAGDRPEAVKITR